MAITHAQASSAHASEKAAGVKNPAASAHHRQGNPPTAAFANALQDLLDLDIPSLSSSGTDGLAADVDEPPKEAGAADAALLAAPLGLMNAEAPTLPVGTRDPNGGKAVLPSGQGHDVRPGSAIDLASAKREMLDTAKVARAEKPTTEFMRAPSQNAEWDTGSARSSPSMSTNVFTDMTGAQAGMAPSLGAGAMPATPLAEHIAGKQMGVVWRAGAAIRPVTLASRSQLSTEAPINGADFGGRVDAAETGLAQMAALGVHGFDASRAGVVFRQALAETPTSGILVGTPSTMAFVAEGNRRGWGVERGGDGSAGLSLGGENMGMEASSATSGDFGTDAAADAAQMLNDAPEPESSLTAGEWTPQSAQLRLQGAGDALDVSIQLAGNQVLVDFAGGESSTRDALAQSRSELSQLLQNEGMQLAGMSVQAGMGGSSQPQQDQAQGGQPSERALSSPEIPADAGGDRLARPVARSAQGQLDVFV